MNKELRILRSPANTECFTLAMVLFLSTSLPHFASSAQGQVTYWADGFESYTVGAAAPDPWSADGNGDVITSDHSHSGGKSMQLSGSGSCWEGLCDREVPVTNALLMTFAVNPSSSHWGGCHPYVAFAGMRNTRSWTTANKGHVFVWFDRDTQMILLGDDKAVFGGWQFDQWREIDVLYEKVQTNIVLTYWIDGVKAGPYLHPLDPEEDTIKYLEFGSGDGVTWVDDVQVASPSSAHNLTVLKLQAKLNFAKANTDSCSLKATLDLGVGFNPAGKPMTLDLGDAQVSFTLDNKGRGIGYHSVCRLAYSKKTGAWTLTAKLRGGDWQTSWATYGMVDADVSPLGVPVGFPVVVHVGDDTFAAEKSLIYRAKQGKSGTAK